MQACYNTWYDAQWKTFWGLGLKTASILGGSFDKGNVKKMNCVQSEEN